MQQTISDNASSSRVGEATECKDGCPADRMHNGVYSRHCENCSAIVPVEQSGPADNDLDVKPEHGGVYQHNILCRACFAATVPFYKRSIQQRYETPCSDCGVAIGERGAVTIGATLLPIPINEAVLVDHAYCRRCFNARNLRQLARILVDCADKPEDGQDFAALLAIRRFANKFGYAVTADGSDPRNRIHRALADAISGLAAYQECLDIEGDTATIRETVGDLHMIDSLFTQIMYALQPNIDRANESLKAVSGAA